MSFNPSKCNIIHMNRKKKPILNNYYLKGERLEPVEHAKYLGITISNNLSWSKHIGIQATKANQSLGFIKRTIPISAPQHVKEMAYKTLVRPQVEYACAVWAPYQSCDIDNLEMINRRAARYVLGYNRFSRDSVTQMLLKLQWDTLQIRREYMKLTLMYKILHNLVAIPNHQFSTSSQHNTRGNTLKFTQIQAKQKYYQQSFFPSIIPLWNALPTETATATSIEAFKSSLAVQMLVGKQQQ